MNRFAAALAVTLLSITPACKKTGDNAKKGTSGAPATHGSEQTKPAQPPAAPDEKQADSDLAKLVEGQNAFALALYDVLRKQEGNLAFSPASVNAALAMTYAGARRETAVEMKNALRLEVTGKRLHRAYEAWLGRLPRAAGEDGSELTLANRLWADQGLSILADFSGILADHYGAPVAQLDFLADLEGSRTAINDWIEEQTHDRIQDLVEPGDIDDSTRLVLTNAIYFAGTWAEKFDPSLTKPQPFHAPGGDADVPMMHQSGDFLAAEANGVRVLVLPYQGGGLSMVILLPEARDGLPALEAQLGERGLDAHLLGVSKQRVSVALPRLTVEAGFRLKEALSALGMPSAFVKGKADLSGITGNRDLFISAVIHKAFVQVDEKGTEAAAATAVLVQRSGMPSKAMEFVADHPFLYLIRDEQTGSILFLGRVTKP